MAHIEDHDGTPVLVHEVDGYQTEDRVCCNCKNFKDMGMMQIPICTRKLMGVTRTMRVTFKTADGTCFESMPHTGRGDAL